MRRFLILIAVMLSTATFANDETRISNGRYITGGILGSAIGFGVGHAVQKRYLPLGLIFSVGETAALVALLADSRFTSNLNGNITDAQIGPVGIVGLSVMVGLHVWEILDVWISGAKQLQRAGESKLSVLPVSGHESAPGMSMVYRF